MIVIVLTTTVAFADSFDVAYDDGTAAFEAKDYAKARVEFLKAYELRPEPVILYNVAQTYRLDGDTKQAIEYYKRYLADSRAAANLRQKAQNYVTQLEEAANKVEEDRLRVERRAKDSDGTPASIGITPHTQPAPPLTLSTRRTRRIPLGTKIAGAIASAGLITSLALTKKGLDVESDFQRMPTPGAAQDRVEKYQSLINVSWGFTGAAAATAVVLYFAAPKYTTERKTVVIAPDRDGGWSAALVGRF